ncbi:MAG TPA: hypothetical protein VK874_06065 [Gaiellaceae bacterium]|nr:hypothetical protein [Gaiellaceae bacterium]
MTTGPPVEPALEDVVADAAATAGFPFRSPRPGIWLAPLGRVEAVDVARLARELRARYALAVAPVPPTSDALVERPPRPE